MRQHAKLSLSAPCAALPACTYCVEDQRTVRTARDFLCGRARWLLRVAASRPELGRSDAMGESAEKAKGDDFVGTGHTAGVEHGELGCAAAPGQASPLLHLQWHRVTRGAASLPGLALVADSGRCAMFHTSRVCFPALPNIMPAAHLSIDVRKGKGKPSHRCRLRAGWLLANTRLRVTSGQRRNCTVHVKWVVK